MIHTSVIEGGTRNTVIEPQLVLGMSCARLGVGQSLWTGSMYQVVVCKVVGGAMQRAPNGRRRFCIFIHNKSTTLIYMSM